jgi:hypothetical protein
MVLVVDPATRVITVYCSDRHHVLGEADVLDGGDDARWRLPVREVFASRG